GATNIDRLKPYAQPRTDNTNDQSTITANNNEPLSDDPSISNTADNIDQSSDINSTIQRRVSNRHRRAPMRYIEQ
ncbi:unnamed protein product, partial [Adineta ricciae]